MNIGIDIDGVCGNYCEPALHYLNKKLNLHYTMDQMKTYWFETIITEVSQEVIVAILTQFRNEGNLCQIPVIPGVQKAIWELSEQHNITIVTARDVCTREDTENWLCQKSIIYDDLIFIGSNEKAAYIKAHCDIHIDDCPEVAKKVANENIPVLLFDQMWNRDFIPVIHSHMIVRACGWQEVVRIIRGIPCH